MEEGVFRAGPDLEVLISEGLESVLASSRPMLESEIKEWAIAWRGQPYSDEAEGGRSGALHFARWDEEGFDGACLRVLTRSSMMLGRFSPDGIRVMGRVFARTSAVILGERDDGFGLFDADWAFGAEYRPVGDLESWARSVANARAGSKGRSAPTPQDWPVVELADPESLALALKERWELEKGVAAPSRGLSRRV